MKREQATALIGSLYALDEPLGAVDVALGSLEDETERKKWKRVFGNIMALLDTDVMIPVLKQFPDMDRDRE